MNQYKNRFSIITGILLLVAVVFIVKLFYIQVINDRYKFSANNNVLRYDVLHAVRGLVYDRDSTLIASNIPSYDLIIIPREVKKMDTLSLCNMIDISIEEFRLKLNKASSYSKFKESVFVKHLDFATASNLNEKLFQYSGFFLRTNTMRKYTSNVGTHLLGYLGEVNKKKTIDNKYYTKGDIAGVSGIEAAYEPYLRGKKGMAITLVDVHNRNQGKFNDGKFDTLSVPGSNIITTIDAELQKYGELLMRNKKGAIVAIEPESGEILSLISAPTYDPNMLSGRKRSENFTQLMKDKNKPLFNRALLGEYPPGSIFKLLNGLIALQEGTLTANTVYSCDNGYHYGNSKKVGCHVHTSPLRLKKGIALSCNAFFCSAFEYLFNKYPTTDLAYDNWHNHIKSFGIGEWMNNDFSSGRKGLLPKPGYYNSYYGKGRWKYSTIISMAIGQGELLLTPIQMANMTAIIANRGYFYTPHIIKKIDGIEHIDSTYTTKKFCTIAPEYFNPIIEGMEDVIEDKEGTANQIGIPEISICGKTGTAQNPHGDDHSIFIAFAPKENPKIALAVYVENGGWGSTWAAPIASLMIEQYLKGYISNTNLEHHILKGNLINN